jgi:hypothetical protein
VRSVSLADTTVRITETCKPSHHSSTKLRDGGTSENIDEDGEIKNTLSIKGTGLKT